MLLRGSCRVFFTGPASRVVRLGQFPAPEADPMSEDERLELLGSNTEAHAALSEAAFKLHSDLQRLELADPNPAERSGLLADLPTLQPTNLCRGRFLRSRRMAGLASSCSPVRHSSHGFTPY